MSLAWLAHWDRLNASQQRAVLAAVEIRPHPDDADQLERIIRPGASQRQVRAAIRLLATLEGPKAPDVGAFRVFARHEENGLSYERLADDPAVRRYLTRTRRSSVESRRKIAFQAVKRVKMFRRAVRPWLFQFHLSVATNDWPRRNRSGPPR